jgi:hypothetical protein
MSVTYHIRIKKDYAEAIIKDLEKMKAVELIEQDKELIPEWQKKEVRRRAKEVADDPSILVDEKTVFDLLNRD